MTTPGPHRPIVVVGAGIAGLAVSAHLGPHRVTLLERGRGPAAESSAHGIGMIRRLCDDPLERTLALRTAAWLRGWAPPSMCRATGALMLSAHDPTALNDGVAHLRAAGVAIDEVEPASVAPIFVGTPIRRGWSIADELTVDPVAIAHRLAQELLAADLDLRPGIDVRGLRIVAGRVTGVHTDAGEVAAEQVVLATGAWSEGFAARELLSRPLVPLRRTVFELAAAHDAHPWGWIEDVGLYLRPTEAGFLASPCDEAVEHDPPAGSRGDASAAAEVLLREKLRRYVPALAEAPVRRGWTGLRTFAPDRRAVLGADPDVAGLWWVAGLGGYGLTCGYAAAEAVATWMGGGAVPWLPPGIVSPGRRHLARFPIRPTGEHDRARLISAYHPSSG